MNVWIRVFACAGFGALGCYHAPTVETAPIPSVVGERRYTADRRVPPVSGEWRLEDGAVVGALRWQRCVLQRTWTTGEVRTTRREPNRVVGGVLLATGIAMITTSLGLALASDEESPDAGGDGAVIGLRWGGAVVGGIGSWQTFWARPRGSVERVNVRDHKTRTWTDCARVPDLDELRLVLVLPERKALVGGVDAEGVARIPIPQGVTLPAKAELPVRIYRVPRSLTTLLERWQRVGTLRVGE